MAETTYHDIGMMKADSVMTKVLDHQQLVRKRSNVPFE